ncbi:MAG: helix-turn-helix domain-containing protein [Trueperaceae bacterium]
MQRRRVNEVDRVSSLGEAIRTLRRNRQMTLEELGKLSSLSTAMISKIESGNGNPSINSLRQISEALGVPVAYLFSHEIDPNPDPVAYNHKRIYSYEGVTFTVLASPYSRQQKLFLFEAEAGAERGSTRIPHEPHEGFEQGIVIEGEIEFTVSGKIYPLRRFDTISFPSILHHSWINRTSDVCRAVWSISMNDPFGE